jgi:hypothetical protein
MGFFKLKMDFILSIKFYRNRVADSDDFFPCKAQTYKTSVFWPK